MIHGDNSSRLSSAVLHPPTPATSASTGKIALAALGIVALACAAPAGADPSPGHDAKVKTQTPPMLCEIGSDDETPGVGPNVVCQGSFAQASPENDQAVVTASGQFSYRTANIGVGYEHAPFDTLLAGQTYNIQGWTIVVGGDGIRFSHDDTGHGMFIGSDTTVNPF
jgi:hypothetical protein